MADEKKIQDNLDRLLKHLKDDSLAALLVQTYRASEIANRMESMRAVLRERLIKLREKNDDPED